MMRVGTGYDVHRLKAGRKLVLGGVLVPSAQGLDGHSDADVLLHAIIDALLGAAALGDIGQHFPDTDLSYKDSDSRELLRRVAGLLNKKYFTVVNIDATIVAESPKLEPYIADMRSRIAADLNLDMDTVSVKATTSEGIGMIGRNEGMSAMATCLIMKQE